jgi:hypothetical protein
MSEKGEQRLRRVWLSQRWKGELYLLPTVRLAWPIKDSNLCNSTWIGFYWLQWSFHVYIR